jgi:hypothetical protein
LTAWSVSGVSRLKDGLRDPTQLIMSKDITLNFAYQIGFDVGFQLLVQFFIHKKQNERK